jgi:hypothetical protein
VILWNAETWEYERFLGDLSSQAASFSFSPDNKWLAAASAGNVARI